MHSENNTVFTMLSYHLVCPVHNGIRRGEFKSDYHIFMIGQASALILRGEGHIIVTKTRSAEVSYIAFGEIILIFKVFVKLFYGIVVTLNERIRESCRLKLIKFT